jgi:cytochrome c-type biogenesis protein CcmH/NrfG
MEGRIEGEEAARRALRLSPHDPLATIYLGMVAYARFVRRDYPAAIEAAREAVHGFRRAGLK